MIKILIRFFNRIFYVETTVSTDTLKYYSRIEDNSGWEGPTFHGKYKR